MGTGRAIHGRPADSRQCATVSVVERQSADGGAALDCRIGLLMSNVFVIYLGYGAALPVLPDFVLRLLNEPSVVAWHTGSLTAMFMASLFLLAPVWGRVSDRIGRRPVLLMGLAGCVLSMVAFAGAPNLAVAYAARLGGGVFAAAVAPAAVAYVVDISASADRPRRVAWMGASMTGGFLVGPVIGGWLSGLQGGAVVSLIPTGPAGLPFIATALIGGVIWVLTWFGLADVAAFQARHGGGISAPQPSIGRYLFYALLATVALGGFEVGFTLLAIQELGLSALGVGNLFVVCSLSMLIVQVAVFARLRARAGFRTLGAGGFAAMLLGLIGTNLSTDAVGLVLAVGLVGLGSGLLIPLFAAEVAAVGGSSQGGGQGRLIAASSLGQSIGSAGVGWIFGLSVSFPFWVLAGVSLLGLAAVLAKSHAVPAGAG